jgi:DNA excision repair protein ERCC-2
VSEKTIYAIDVRTLAEILFQEGNLGLPLPAGRSALEGMKAHKKLQDRGIEGYRAEVPIAGRFPGERLDLEISGRADGIYEKDGLERIEEIKTTGRDPERLSPESNPAHAAQLGIYGWLRCLELSISVIGLDLVYVQRASGRTRVFPSIKTAAELESHYGTPIRAFLGWLDLNEGYRLALRAQLASLEFPFPEFRPGQRDAAKEVFRSIRDRAILFLQAPTGIGKTMAVLYPALKALGQGFGSKLFFLTAKNSGAAAAEKALDALSLPLPQLRWISITAKAKICFLLSGDGDIRGEYARPPCDPALCPYARDYFSKSRQALFEVFSSGATGGEALSPAGGTSRAGRFTRAEIEKIARERGICPFEFSLDLSLYCDVVVADCNYAFDYGARLKRFFAAGRTDYVFLADEAHNLVDRARSMFSTRISKRRVLEVRRSCTAAEKSVLSRLNSFLLGLKKEIAIDASPSLKRFPAGLDARIAEAVEGFESLIEQGAPLSASATELYWELIRSSKVIERYDESYRTIASAAAGDFSLDLLCIDPAKQLQEVLSQQRACVFFSGSLTPPSYFMKLIAPDMSPEFLSLPSPFPPENCSHLARSGVSTRWKDRERNAELYAQTVREAFAAVRGNQIVFSPSFAFQNALLARLGISGAMPEKWIAQKPGMTNREKEAFVAAFEGEEVRGFAVASGSFSESIDLAGERLVGAIVFGLGLPQVNAFNETIRDFFESKWGNGYAWAYLYPGMNRVLQAAGRVIRSDKDRGFVLLVDERYLSAEYRRLMPEHWELKEIQGPEDFIRALPAGLARSGARA